MTRLARRIDQTPEDLLRVSDDPKPGVALVWQIVTVAVLGLRVKSVFVPLVLRAGIILIFAVR